MVIESAGATDAGTGGRPEAGDEPLVARLRVEQLAEPLGLGTGSPRLSWQLTSTRIVPTRYEVRAVVNDGPARHAVLDSAEQVLVPWPFEPLASRDRATVSVRVGDDAQWSGWSEPVELEVGLLEQADWSASLVSPRELGGLDDGAPLVFSSFRVAAGLVRARLYVTAHGIYEVRLNGAKVGDDLFTPGWTSYHHRLRYQTYDVVQGLVEGENRIQALLGNGWFRGNLTWDRRRDLYGDRLALLAQLELTYADGRVEVVATDESWSATTSDVLRDDLYDGQRTDLRLSRLAGPGTRADAVERVDADLARLEAPTGPPVRVTAELPAQRVWTSPSGRTLVDFGQNVVGWVRLTVRGAHAGDEVLVRHAEVLEHDELGVRPLRTARATDGYLLAGAGEEILEPSLTFHGFRYAEVSGVADLAPGDVVAVVVGTDLERRGWFRSSHELLNRLHENVVWGTRGNFLDVPTDCPQRDERLGWAGDIQVFSPTASFLFDVSGFLDGWLRDLAADQYDTGGVPWVVPNTLPGERREAAAWGDASAVVPWVLYERYADVEVLRRQLGSMRAWVDRIAELAGEDLIWDQGFQFGDWLDPTAPPEDPARAQCSPEIVATAHLVRSARIVASAARVVGADDVAREYADLARRAGEAFAREYVTPRGRVLSDSQTAYAMALVWSLFPDEASAAHGSERLADLVRRARFTVSTGFVGTPLILDALAAAGHPELAYRMLLETACPSWLYPVTMGATTIWERWDSMEPDGSINPGEMTSFNHYALGAVADFLHREVAGLAPAAPGYRRVRVAPLVDRSLTFAEAVHDSPYGRISAGWRREDDLVRIEVSLPPGVTGEVLLPGSQESIEVGPGEHVLETVLAPGDVTAPRTVRELLDDRERWDALAAGLHALGAHLEAIPIDRLLESTFDQPVHALFDELVSPQGGIKDKRAQVQALLDEAAGLAQT